MADQIREGFLPQGGRVTAVDTQIKVGSPQLDLNRPTSGMAEVLTAGAGLLIDTFKPKANLNTIFDTVATDYNNRLTELEQSGNLNNTAIAQLNRTAKLNLTSQLSRVGADPKILNSYMGNLKEIFESDQRYQALDKGAYSTVSSYGDLPKMIVNDEEEMVQRAALESQAKMTPEVRELYLSWSPSTQATFRQEQAINHIHSEQVSHQILVGNGLLNAYKLEDRERDQIQKENYAIYLGHSQRTLAQIVPDLLRKVRGEGLAEGEAKLTPEAAHTLLKAQIANLTSEPAILELAKQNPAVVDNLMNQLRAYDIGKEGFEALGTNIAELTREQIGLDLAFKISQRMAFNGLAPNVQSYIHLAKLMGENAISWRMLDETLKFVDSGEPVRWSMSTNNTLRELSSDMGYLASNSPKENVPVEQLGLGVRSKLYASMQAFVLNKPTEAPLNIEGILESYPVFLETPYFQSLPIDKQSQFNRQYTIFLEKVANVIPEYEKLWEAHQRDIKRGGGR